MSEPWTHEALDQLDAVVESLLAAPLPGPILWALAEQQRLIETQYQKLGQQRQLIHRLSAEVETLKAIIEDSGDDDEPWDEDGRSWW
jgi:hypothetical protein